MLKAPSKTMLKLIVAAGFTLLAQGSALADDADKGKAIAERWCASCHVVGSGQKSAPTDQAPPFASLAVRRNFNADKLAFLLLRPHPTMPELSLSQAEASDIVDYIRTLK